MDPTETISLTKTYNFVHGAIRFPALTMMVFLRRDIGYRLLNPFVLFATFGLVAVVTILATPGNEAARPWDLIIFCGVGFLNGLAQRIRRWRELNKGINQHSYFIGNSPFEFHWLPTCFRRNRRIARYCDPIFCSALGLLLLPYSRFLGLWLIFSAFCLKAYEAQMFQDLRNRNIDLIDAVLVAESQSRRLEHLESEPVISVSQSDHAIPTGLGDDIESNIEQHRKARDTRRG